VVVVASPVQRQLISAVWVVSETTHAGLQPGRESSSLTARPNHHVLVFALRVPFSFTAPDSAHMLVAAILRAAPSLRRAARRTLNVHHPAIARMTIEMRSSFANRVIGCFG